MVRRRFDQRDVDVLSTASPSAVIGAEGDGERSANPRSVVVQQVRLAKRWTVATKAVHQPSGGLRVPFEAAEAAHRTPYPYALNEK